MKKITLITLTAILVTSLLLTGCQPFVKADNQIEGSGNLETRQYEFSDFTRVDIGNAFDYEIKYSEDYDISITADDNLFEYILVTREGETLKIGLKPFTHLWGTTVKADISMPWLYGLDASGATKGTVTGFTSDKNFDLSVSGASRLTLADISTGDVSADIGGASRVDGELNSGDASFDISGASRVELEGSAGDTEIDASGASQIELVQFTVKDADISLSGSSDIRGSLEALNIRIDASGASGADLEGPAKDIIITASGASRLGMGSVPARNASISLSGASRAEVNLTGRLDVDLSGGSDLEYTGEPTLGNIEVSGGASVERKS